MSKIDTMLQVGRTFGMRDGMLRLQYELQRGSGLMSWKMRSVQGWDSWDLKRIAPGAKAEDMRAARRDGTRPFFFADAQVLGTGIRKIIGREAEQSILAEAGRVVAGHLPFFGQLSFACGFPPQWFRNPVTGQTVSPRQPWTQMRFASPAYGDLKFILESSRFLFVYPLIRAYVLSGDEKFPAAFWIAMEDWARHSSPMAGPLWICGQECSLRILAWSFALQAFIHSPSTTNERVALLVSMIAAHAWRTAQTLGYARSQRSNHLISEAVGLWTAGTLYPELREAQVWRNLGAHLLHEAVLDQITAEGVSQQHSFNYQRMILHLLLWTLRLAELHHASLHDDIHTRTEAAFDFMRAWVDTVSGSAPNYGSDDGSLILPLAAASYRDFRPLIQVGAAVLNRPALPPGPWDETALWLGVNPECMKKCVKENVPAPPSIETGYFRLGDENSWALIRAGRYTRRPFQADQVHVDLWWNGMNLARDAGTYLYNGPVPWNNGLAGSAVHNTVTVDHQDQMRRAGRFLWLDWAQASGRLYSSRGNPCADRFEGEHDGYSRFGVTHRRMVQWLAGLGWVIVDDINGIGEHDVRLHWLAADLPFEFSDSPFQAVFASGQSRIRWSILASVPGSAAVIRGGKQIKMMTGNSSTSGSVIADTQLLGWESPTYGDLRPAVSLVYQIRSQLPVRLTTVILTDQRCRLESGRLESGDGELVILRSESADRSETQSEIFRGNLSAKRPHAVSTQPSAVSVPRT
ncbi:MAG: alginate lyase family protein [Candidatus Sulfotelmatobacter sp.]